MDKVKEGVAKLKALKNDANAARKEHGFINAVKKSKSAQLFYGGITGVLALIGLVLIVGDISNADIRRVKNGFLNSYPETTIGKAFNNQQSFKKISWHTKKTDNGQKYVVFQAEVKESHLLESGAEEIGVTDPYVGVVVAFLLDDKGNGFKIQQSAVMGKGIDSNGEEAVISYLQFIDLNALLNLIYNNRKLTFETLAEAVLM